MDESTLSILSLDSKEKNIILHSTLRLQVVSTHISLGTRSPFTNAYAYAWAKNIYPAGHPDHGLHHTLQANWHISQSLVERIIWMLVNAHENNQPIGIGRLLAKRHNDFVDATSQEWSEGEVLTACRYIFLSEVVHSRVWEFMLEHDAHKKAEMICFPFEPEEIQIC